MASPPPSATSPPAPSSLALPRQRPGPGLALPTATPNPRRKPSTASATSTSHPLRQTSFPPESYGAQNTSAMYSPEGSAEISDSEITSAISGTTGGNAGEGSGVGKKRKRGEKKARGRPPKNAALGDDARSTTGTQKGAPSTTGKGDEAEQEEEDDEDDAAGGATHADEDEGAAQMEEADRRGKEFLLHMPEWQLERHGTWKRAKLKTNNVKTLVNSTLSQSVPAHVITVVSAYTKMFAGLIVEGARDVQGEWMAVAEKRPNGDDNAVLKRMRGERPDDTQKSTSEKAKETNGKDVDPDVMEVEPPIKKEDASPKANDQQPNDDTQPDTENGEHADGPDGHGDEGRNGIEAAPAVQEASMGIRRQLDEVDRGPLLPDHLRESLRRYKKAHYGGTVGFTGLSLEGKDNTAARMGGRKLFK